MRLFSSVSCLCPPGSDGGVVHTAHSSHPAAVSRKSLGSTTCQSNSKNALCNEDSSSSVNLTNKKVENAPKKGGVIRNFRQARGIPNIYRCAKTDHLSELEYLPQQHYSPAEDLILCRAGLIVDLRSDAERNVEKAKKWTEFAPGGSFIVQYKKYNTKELETSSSSSRRVLLYLDPLESHDFMTYVEKFWLTPHQQKQADYYRAVDSRALKNLRMETLHNNGLAGLNEAILEIGKIALCNGLKAITLHMENHDTPVVINCLHGKDRTGILVMLIQSLLGVSDSHILQDYHKSEATTLAAMTMKNNNNNHKSSSSSSESCCEERLQFFRAPKEVMLDTLDYLRSEYGSVSPGYLDDIGFNDSWRKRLQTVIRLRPPHRRSKNVGINDFGK